MEDFTDKFQVYSNIIFLMFDIENKLHKELRERLFSACFSRECYIEYKGVRYYVPFTIKIDKNKVKYDEYKELLGFTPAFSMQLGKRNQVEVTTSDMSNYNVNCEEDIAIVKAAMREENRKLFGMVGGEASDAAKELLKKFGFEFEVVDGNVVIESIKTVITKQSLMLLPPEYDDYDVISENIQNFYISVYQGNCRGLRSSLGYYIRKNKQIIDQHANQHIAIIDGKIYDVL